MERYTIYMDTIIFMALYIKRQYVKSGEISLTQQQMDNYYTLLLQALKKESQTGKPFAFSILKGSPRPNPNFRNTDYIRAQRTRYRYGNGIYSTNASESDLSFVSLLNAPNQLRHLFTPNGFEKALGLEDSDPADEK